MYNSDLKFGIIITMLIVVESFETLLLCETCVICIRTKKLLIDFILTPSNKEIGKYYIILCSSYVLFSKKM